MLAAFLTYFSILKVRHVLPKGRLIFNGLHGGVTQKIELFKKCLTITDPENDFRGLYPHQTESF
jgi:hypothetical protein